MAKKLSLDALQNRASSVSSYQDEDFANPGLRAKVQRKRRCRVKTSLLVPHKKNGFKVDEDEDFEELVAVIKQDGVSNTIIATEQDNGTFKVLSGHRRAKAALAAGLEEVEVWVIPPLTPSEELAYMTRENLGGRKDDPFGKALMIYYYNQEQEKLPEDERISAGDAMKFKRSSFIEYSQLATLGEEMLLFGQNKLFTRELAVNMAKTLRDHPTAGKKLVEDVLNICHSDASDEEKVKQIKELCSGKTKKMAPKKINVFNSVKKVKSLVNDFTKPEASLPKNKARREELKSMAEDTIKELENLIESLEK